MISKKGRGTRGEEEEQKETKREVALFHQTLVPRGRKGGGKRNSIVTIASFS